MIRILNSRSQQEIVCEVVTVQSFIVYLVEECLILWSLVKADIFLILGGHRINLLLFHITGGLIVIFFGLGLIS